MFIELTDHLRCPANHDEAFLVLLPDAMSGRSVVTGQLGCPACGNTFRLEQGILDIGGAPPEAPAESALDAPAIATLGGIHGPGGYFVLAGKPSRVWPELAKLNPGIGLVVVNPDAEVTDAPGLSIIRGGMFPLKTNTMRGVVLGTGYGSDPHWVREAARITLPGLRIVGEGPEPPVDVIELMASTGGAWVGSKRR